jgi:alpha-glucosidase
MEKISEQKEQDFTGNYMDNFEKGSDSEIYPGKILNWWRSDWKFYFEAQDTTLEVSVLSDFIFRFRFSVYEYFEDDFSYAVPKIFESHATKIIFSESDHFYIIKTLQLSCFISKLDLRTKILNNKDEVLLEDEKGYHWLEEKNH